MDRRGYLKTVVSFGVISVTSFSLFKWFDLNKRVDPGKIWDKRAIIAEIAELIIPETNTPGARSAGVDHYIIDVLINCNPVRQQHKFYEGLEDLEDYALSKYDKEFMFCSLEQKHAVLQHFADHAAYSNRILNKINNKFLGQSFFSKIKSLTVEGYCLSRVGATKALAYDYIPGSFEACVPLQLHQKSWATK
ncbi:gluconate 2-dehydrogenase subunit 3 family protein [Pedobacter sp. MC2016-15]|uniref:gluconate 2-dehydrogenase subunit 3 family protein n=1 Tax=Pedobacter sp. MC2016-15 TaxID=2994473 RepID=UPI0022461A65|nr:gluconate 2-dehydrogenase subunit 3 family protein [Pedobacter sp. MC2016-15]MCX2479507.1 gluconate 2-dehydrogenase subunit 3 family protein [Pedobacter sp. MC2016-15]